MNFGVLKEIFRNHALKLLESKEPTARFRSNSYGRVVTLIESKYKDNEVVTVEKVQALALTKYMSDKIIEVMHGKKLKLSQDDQPNNSLKSKLLKIKGIGSVRADQLIKDGLTDIKQLSTKKWLEKLPIETRTYLGMKPKSPIPREDILAIEPYLTSIRGFRTQIVGSFRREKAYSNDIDLMLVSKDTNALERFLKKLMKKLNGNVYPYSNGPDKLSVIINMNDILGKKDCIYKIDVFRVPPEEYIPMLLYSTGSKEHNILMRRIAKQKGMLLNQKGLFRKVNNGYKKISGLNTEESYFKVLGMVYKKPKDRIN